MKFIKLIPIFCLLLISSLTFNQNDVKAFSGTDSIKVAQVKTVTKYVNSKSGVVIRKSASPSAENIGSLCFGAQVLVHSTDKTGWSYITVGDIKGYVADSFLSTKKPTLPASCKKSPVIDFSMNINQVQKNESSKLIERFEELDIGVLIYESNKYGYYAELVYYFVEGKLQYVVYDFFPEKDSYHTWSEMSVLHDILNKQATKEFGKGSFVSDKYSHLSTMWEKENFDILLRVDDDNLYTEAKLLFHEKLY